MITVELPDGTPVDFPDGTDPAVMKSAMQKHWWKANDRRMAADKPAAPKPLPKQGEANSPAGVGAPGRTFTTPFGGQVQIPTGEDVQNFFAGAGRRADQIMDRGGQLLSGNDPAVARGLEEKRKERERLDAPLMNTTAGQAGEIATDVGLTAVPATKVVKGAAAFGSPLAKTVAGLAGAGALNSVYDVGTRVTKPGEEVGDKTLSGFGWGAGGQAAGQLGGKLIKGAVPVVKGAVDEATGRIKKMYDKATLGQIADKDTTTGRIASGIEEGVGSIPLVGSVIKNKRKAGVDQWRDELMDEVTPEGVKKIRGSTAKRIQHLQEGFGDEYDDALAGNLTTPDPVFRAKIFQRAMDPSTGLPPDARKTLAQNIDEQYVDLFRAGSVGPNGPVPAGADATALKAMESRLGKQARQRGMSATPDGPATGELTRAIRDDLRTSYRSQLPRANAGRVRELDQSYAPYKTVEHAATAVGNQEGQFTPSQLLLAIKARTPKPEFAAREGMLQEHADVGKQVFNNRLSDSGTAERAIVAGGSLAGLSMLDPAALLIPGLVTAGTTKSGRNLMTGKTRAQLLLQKLRADQLAENSGVGLAQSIEDLLEQ